MYKIIVMRRKDIDRGDAPPTEATTYQSAFISDKDAEAVKQIAYLNPGNEYIVELTDQSKTGEVLVFNVSKAAVDLIRSNIKPMSIIKQPTYVPSSPIELLAFAVYKGAKALYNKYKEHKEQQKKQVPPSQNVPTNVQSQPPPTPFIFLPPLPYYVVPQPPKQENNQQQTTTGGSQQQNNQNQVPQQQQSNKQSDTTGSQHQFSVVISVPPEYLNYTLPSPELLEKMQNKLEKLEKLTSSSSP